MSEAGSESEPHLLAAIVLAHEHPALVARLIGRLSESCDTIVLHWDAKADQAALDDALATLPAELRALVLLAPRVAVGWAGWSMVEATLGAIATLVESGRAYDHAMLLSGADYPIRSAAELKAFLARHRNREFIEAVDPSEARWMVGGLNQERYRYHHFLDWRRRPRLHHWFWRVQARLGLRRRLPKGLKPAFGSQWWALTRRSVEWVHERSKDSGLRRFFRTVWIPDEMYVQTLLRSSPSAGRIAGRTLTHVQFSPRGRPLSLHDDHLDYLCGQPFFFARKLAPEALALRDALDRLQRNPDPASVAAAPLLLTETGSADYPIFLDVFAHGVRGRRVPGRVNDPWYGDLEWNERPYLLLVGVDDRQLGQAARALARRPGWVAFGSLFDPRRIDWGPSALRLPSFDEGDVALRDHAAPTFLVQVLNAAPPGNVVLTANLRHRSPMTEVLLWDRNATIVLLEPLARRPGQGEEGARALHGLLEGHVERSASGTVEWFRGEMRRVAHHRSVPFVETFAPPWLAGGPVAVSPPTDADPPLDGGKRLVVLHPARGRRSAPGGLHEGDWLDVWNDVGAEMVESRTTRVALPGGKLGAGED